LSLALNQMPGALMSKQWQVYCEKYVSITPREQYMVLLTGLIAIIFIIYSFFIDDNGAKMATFEQQIMQLSSSNRAAKTSIDLMEEGLSQDPNLALNRQILQYKERVKNVDVNLLKLTSDLIDPVQMRYALIKLLQTQKDVSLQSFQVIAAQPITIASSTNVVKTEGDKVTKNEANQQDLILYRHAIKIKLSGSYFQLRDYLTQLEALSWKFFWQEFNYQLKEYPVSELEIEMYSLSTKREFIGV
jgi:MSHA biogenesis protein MshJ